jgi:MFS family permease
LSGFGWFVDNMWLQGVAIILPRVRAEFGSSTPVSWMTFGLYVGLIIGAAGWGVLADIIGRRPAFNATLFLAGVFGIAAGAAPSYVGLGGLLAALGVGLGGNLPVDGMLFLEFIPGNKQYLLTLLSVFWSLGQLFASLIAWAFIANYSCEGDNSNIAEFGPCVGNNAGWRYTFYTLGAVTFAMFFARFAIFQLPESPKFLLSEGRDAEAVAVVKEIAARNGRPLDDDILSVAILRSAAGEDESMDANNEVVAHEKRGLAGIVDMPKQLFNAMRRIRPSTFKPDLRLVRPLFSSPKVAYNTSIIFILWAFIGLAYPLYNAFLPLFLERRGTTTGASDVNTVYSQYACESRCSAHSTAISSDTHSLHRHLHLRCARLDHRRVHGRHPALGSPWCNGNWHAAHRRLRLCLHGCAQHRRLPHVPLPRGALPEHHVRRALRIHARELPGTRPWHRRRHRVQVCTPPTPPASHPANPDPFNYKSLNRVFGLMVRTLFLSSSCSLADSGTSSAGSDHQHLRRGVEHQRSALHQWRALHRLRSPHAHSSYREPGQVGTLSCLAARRRTAVTSSCECRSPILTARVSRRAPVILSPAAALSPSSASPCTSSAPTISLLFRWLHSSMSYNPKASASKV